MKKRIISLILVVLLVALCLPTTAFAASSLSNFVKINTYKAGQFTDVQNQWFAPYVQAAYEYGLINGSSKSTFSPGNNLTLAEAIKLAACLHSIYNTGAVSIASGTPWYQPYVNYALQNGIIKEAYNDYTVPATRADFAAIFANALPDEALSAINTINNNAIPDVKIGYSYGPAVYKLYRAGILTGSDSTGIFYPNSSITRDAVAAIATRMANAAYRQPLTLKLKELTATEISQACSPAVFFIELLNKKGDTIYSGSGFFISDSGLAVTNYHVVKNMINAKITTKDGNKYDITGIVDYNQDTDLALIQVGGSGFPYIPLGDSDTAATGSTIYTIGYPLGVDQTVAPGAITNASHPEDGVNYIMISAPISPGSSGGALIDSTGCVIGVTNASYSDGQNLNLAVPINLLNNLSQTKTPVSLATLFGKTFTYYSGYPTIPDFQSVTGCTYDRSSYQSQYQVQGYQYTASDTDAAYTALYDYMDLLDVEGYEYLGYIDMDGVYVYYFNDLEAKWTVGVCVISDDETDYVLVMIGQADKS
jgi:S1-C subfamily serine protease